MTLAHFEGWSVREGRKYKRGIAKEYERENEQKARQQIAAIKARIKILKQRRKASLADARAKCREDRIHLQSRIAERRARILARLRAAAASAREAGKGTCDRRKAAAAAEYANAIEDAERELKGQEGHLRYLRGASTRARARDREKGKTKTKREAKAEQLDALINDLEGLDRHDLIQLAQRWARGHSWAEIEQLTKRRTYTEAFLEWVHDSGQDEVIAALTQHADRRIASLLNEQKKLEKEYERRKKSGDWRGWEHGGIPDDDPEDVPRNDADLPEYDPDPDDGIPF